MLQLKENEMMQVLTLSEDARGIKGYFQMHEENRRTHTNSTNGDNPFNQNQIGNPDVLLNPTTLANDSMTELTATIQRLNAEIASKKAGVAPLIAELKPIRLKASDLQSEHDAKKLAYDSTAAGFESNLTRFKSEVKRYRDDVSKLESEEFKAKCDLEVLSAYESLINAEMKLTSDKTPSDDHKDDKDVGADGDQQQKQKINKKQVDSGPDEHHIGIL